MCCELQHWTDTEVEKIFVTEETKYIYSLITKVKLWLCK